MHQYLHTRPMLSRSADGNSLSNTKRIDMIQLEKVIERGSQNLGAGTNVQWFKFADGTYLMAGRCQFTTAESNTRFKFNLTIPISLSNRLTAACVVTNVYAEIRFCIWTASLISGNQIRFDVESTDTTGSGATLACSFILLGK